MKINNVICVASLILSGCSSTIEKPTAVVKGPSMEAKQVAVEQEASYVTEFVFEKGSDKLSAEAKSDLAANIRKATAQGNIKEVVVITWGDSEYPSVHTQKLTESDARLVKDRNNVIKDYIQSRNGNAKVQLYSMAERPGALKQLFNTSDAKIKRSLETAGVPTTDTAVKVPSKASKSIVLISME